MSDAMQTKMQTEMILSAMPRKGCIRRASLCPAATLDPCQVRENRKSDRPASGNSQKLTRSLIFDGAILHPNMQGAERRMQPCSTVNPQKFAKAPPGIVQARAVKG
jgi:hypothetical protein